MTDSSGLPHPAAGRRVVPSRRTSRNVVEITPGGPSHASSADAGRRAGTRRRLARHWSPAPTSPRDHVRRLTCMITALLSGKQRMLVPESLCTVETTPAGRADILGTSDATGRRALFRSSPFTNSL
jgi:hypothetical protein